MIDKSFLGGFEFADDYLWDKKALWILQHQIKVAGYSVEPFALGYDVASYPKDQGVFSLLRNEWILEPKHKNFDFSNNVTLQKKVQFYSDLINSMIEANESIDKFKALGNKLYTMRQAAISKNGEFSFENLVFKSLRNIGVLDKMNKYMKDNEDKELSL